MTKFTRVTTIIGAVLTALIFVLAHTSQAQANEGNTNTTVVVSYGDKFLVVDQHNVVVSSDFRHCANEDGSGSHIKQAGPCTWNIGDQVDGNGRGLAYVIFRKHGVLHTHYVWANDPTGHGWTWLAENDDCLFKAYKSYARCADGHMPIAHP